MGIEVKPSIEMAAKVADVFNVSLDYLIGKTDLEFDGDTLNELKKFQNYPIKQGSCLFVP